MIRGAGFDFGQVCMTFDTQQWYDFVRSKQHVGPSVIEPEAFFKLEHVADFDIGRIDTTEFISRSKKSLRINVSDSDFLFEYTNNMKPDFKMLSIIQTLKQNGLKLAMISNINSHHYWYVRLVHPRIFACFDYLMLSFKHGFKKPDRRMWEKPVEDLGIPLSEWFYVDDLAANVTVFKQLGGGAGYHYNVTDDKYCSNGRREVERSKLVTKMVGLEMITPAQASNILKIVF